MFTFTSSLTPSWLAKPDASTWNFTTSESAEFDALIFAADKGSFYVVDDDDSDSIVHEILYVGVGLTKSKGPIPFGIGGSFSTFGGSGLILTAAGGAFKGKDYAIILFGMPPFTVAIGRMEGVQYMAPGFGFTAMPCIFTIDP